MPPGGTGQFVAQAPVFGGREGAEVCDDALAGFFEHPVAALDVGEQTHGAEMGRVVRQGAPGQVAGLFLFPGPFEGGGVHRGDVRGVGGERHGFAREAGRPGETTGEEQVLGGGQKVVGSGVGMGEKLVVNRVGFVVPAQGGERQGVFEDGDGGVLLPGLPAQQGQGAVDVPFEDGLLCFFLHTGKLDGDGRRKKQKAADRGGAALRRIVTASSDMSPALGVLGSTREGGAGRMKVSGDGLIEMASSKRYSASGNSRFLVGVRFPQWWSFGMPMLGGVVDFMREHEMWRLATENDSFGEMEAASLDEHWRGDGLILFRATGEELAAHRRAGRAVVLTSSEGPDLGFPRVIPDNEQVGRLAAEHLIECNFDDFAFLGRGETYYREEQFASGIRRYSRERFHGFRDRIGEFQHEPVTHYLEGRPLWEKDIWCEVLKEVLGFLGRLPAPCGLFVADDSLGAVVLRAADELGRRVPGELAVIGFGDDIAYCHATFPPLSSIRFPSRKVGFEAARMLWRQMNGEKLRGEVVRVPVGEVRTRESSDTLAIADPEIREIVGWIRRRAPYDALKVAELAKNSRVSMTTVKQRFAGALGHGPKEEIKRVRLAHLRHLLRHTELTLDEIAKQMSFPTGHEVSRFFFTETGERPTPWRKGRERENT